MLHDMGKTYSPRAIFNVLYMDVMRHNTYYQYGVHEERGTPGKKKRIEGGGGADSQFSP